MDPELTSLNDRCSQWMQQNCRRLAEMGVTRHDGPGGSSIYDFGVAGKGTLAGGLLLAELCTAGLATIRIQAAGEADPLPVPSVTVQSDHPLLACMASQYAGWPLSANGYFAMGSGPARIHRGREPLFEKHPVSKPGSQAWLILESAQLPPPEVVEAIAGECGVGAGQVHVCVARTASLPGTVQVVARSLETTLHKLFELGFDLTGLVAGVGSAPLPPVGKDDLAAIGWTNDAILYGSRVWLVADCDQSAIDAVLPRLPASSSPDFGRPFRGIFERYQRDFYAIDRMLFSPACVTVHNLDSGLTRTVGNCRPDILRESFGMESARVPGEGGAG